MNMKVLTGVLMAFLIFGMPFAQADQLNAESSISVGVSTDTGIQANAEAMATAEANKDASGKTGNSAVGQETKLSSEIKIELDQIRSQKAATVKEAIEKRKALFESLKQRLLNAAPEERSQITKEINKARLEGLKEIKSLIKDAADMKAFEKEKLATAAELCKEGEDAEECEKEIKEIEKKLDSLTGQQLEKLKKLKEKTDLSRKKSGEIKVSENFRKFRIKTEAVASGETRTEIVAREITDTVLNDIRGKQEKLETEKLKAKFQASKGGFSKMKARSEACKDESEECKKIKAEVKMSAKAFLIDSLDFLAARLEKSKLAIEAEASITDVESSTETAKIDQHIAEIKQLKEKAEKITEETNKTVVQDIAKEAGKELAGLKADLDHSAGFVSASKIGGILVKAAKLSEKLNRALEKMEIQGTDTTETEAFVDSFNRQIDEVKNGVELVVEKFKQAALKTGEERNQLVQDAHKSLKELKDKLNELQKQLKEVVKSLKNRGAEKALEETKADEVLETEEKASAEANAEASASAQTTGG